MNIQEKKEVLIKENEKLRNQFNATMQLVKEIQKQALSVKSKLELIEEIEKDAKELGNDEHSKV